MKKNSRLLFILGLILIARVGFGQGIGIGTTSPDGSAVLHIVSKDDNRGLLIPAISINDLNGIIQPTANGLLFYDPGIAKFCFYQGGTWYTLNQMIQTVTQGSLSPMLSHTGDMTVNGSIGVTSTLSAGTVNASNYGLNSTGNGPVPKGGIIMWSGATNAIPTGWALCDGGNNTPDLRDKFVLGAGGSSLPQGGNSSISLSPGQLPSHSHTGTTSSPGPHTHSYADDFAYIDQFWDSQFPGSYLENLSAQGNFSGNGGVDNWSNTFAGRNKTSSAAGDHNHTFTTDPFGSNQAINIMPPYYALAYIMKL